MFAMLAIKRSSLCLRLICLKKPIVMVQGKKMDCLLILAFERMELEYIRLISKSFNMIYGLF